MSRRAKAGLLSAAVLALAALSPRLIPYCMDEFAHYHELGCLAFPLTQKWTAYREGSVFREGCGSYALTLPFTSRPLPLRSYHYIGSWPGIPFYPFWKALNDPVAARVQGACFLLLASALLARLSGAEFSSELVAAFVFPVYALAFVVDLGPVGLSLVLLGLALAALRRAVRAPSGVARLGFGAAAGFVFFLGFWAKLVFAWTVPALAVFASSEVREALRAGAPRTLRYWLPAGAAALITAAFPCVMLLYGIDADGVRYLDLLGEGPMSVGAAVRDLGWHTGSRMSRYLYDGAHVLPRTLSLPASPLDLLPMLITILVVLLGFRDGRSIRLFLAMAAATGFVTALTRNAWGPHHAAFTLYFLVAALGSAIESLRRRSAGLSRVVMACVGLYLLSVLFRLPAATIQADTSFEKDAMLRAIRLEGLAGRVVQAHTSWGTFYIAHLFGDPDQIVVWAPGLPDRPDRIGEIRRIAAAEKRGIAVISHRRTARILTPDLVKEFGAPVAERPFGDWRLVEFLR